MMTTFKDYFSGHSESYSQFRPTYPPDLFRVIAKLTESHDLAWDCATGNGQAAVALAPYFNQIIASDASAQQIEHATQNPKIKYLVSPAESIQAEPDSIDLITVAQGMHWFDIEKFFKETERVLKPGGILAVWSYRLHQITSAIDAVVLKYYDNILGRYWPPERKMVDERYKGIVFPFEPVDLPEFEMTAEWSFYHLIGYLKTWSAAKLYFQKHESEALEFVIDELAEAWGKPDLTRPVIWPLNVIVRRK